MPYNQAMHYCNVLKKTSQRHAALARMEAAIRANPTAPGADRDLFVLGREFRKDHETDKAIELYGHYIQTYPGNTFFTTKAYQYMIDALIEEKRLVLAADTMQEVAGFVNGTMDFRAQMNLGRKFFELNEKPLAEAAFHIGYRNAMAHADALGSDAEKLEVFTDIVRYAYSTRMDTIVRAMEERAAAMPASPDLEHSRFEIAWYGAILTRAQGQPGAALEALEALRANCSNPDRLAKVDREIASIRSYYQPAAN